ncbi:hypothetical protein E8E12_010410 [Didymella heteroderae]|uniref:Uncharacterized protein n=1 Tax=Didymella heteroderae TaxID=1769908 RepID=A0A9P4WXG7_9PLEO|nr:hypothetical protein E8E12_010410 [Didymella heteroderae]
MSLQLFESNLIGPDNTASQQELVNLINAGNFTGSGLPQVAHGYLDAFCNESNSNGRRRWAGIALAAMMRASTGVAQRLKRLTQGLSRVGAIILDPKESEERRIVAGLIVRQGLDVGIDFADFWMSDKVLQSAPHFPRDPSELWMSQFQTYLDTLCSLALANLNDEPLVLYPIALSARDEYQWAGKSAVALLEKDVLTIVASDCSLTRFTFIDLPIHHIQETSLKQDSPHESQEGRSGHKMHQVVLSLRPSPPSYHFNSSDRTADEFKVAFLRHEEAHELDLGLQDARKPSTNSATSATEAAVLARSGNPQRRTHRPSVQVTDELRSPRHEGNPPDGSETGFGATLDEPISSKQVTEMRTTAQFSEQKKSKGKLPRISLSTKQKVARIRQLPSASAKVTLPRASKKTAPIIEESGDEDEDTLSQDEYKLQLTTDTRTLAGTATGRKSQGRRKAYAEDDDFKPKTMKAKPSTKRKRTSSEAQEDRQPTKKKKQTRSSITSRSEAASTSSKKPKAGLQQVVHTASTLTRVPMKQSSAQQNIQNGVAPRPSLIGALKKSNSPSKSTAPTFKKPGQPASTPGRPRTQPVRTTPRPQTPAHDDLPVYGPSSTPRSRSMHDEDFGLGYTPVDTEILSSNTKRVPDSPHAESTAISGHADCEDVQREKCIGDLETAKSDPFKQRQQESQRITSFTRKLTGESFADDKVASPDREPLSMPAEISNGDDETDDFGTTFASRPLLKQSPSLFKSRTSAARQSVQVSVAHIRTVHSLSANESRRMSKPDNPRAVQDILPAAEKIQQVTQQAKVDEFVVSAPPEAIENTLPDASAQHGNHADLEGQTTLVEEEMDLPQRYGTRASDLRFRSSPPIPDSSSVRGDLSDESEQEPEPSPPTSRADELEWEAALQPHQRALHEQLLRTSKRVMRHIVDNETAVTDIADVFAADGERLVNLLVEKQSDESTEAFEELKSKRQDLLKELSNASKNLKTQRRQIRGIE